MSLSSGTWNSDTQSAKRSVDECEIVSKTLLKCRLLSSHFTRALLQSSLAESLTSYPSRTPRLLRLCWSDAYGAIFTRIYDHAFQGLERRSMLYEDGFLPSFPYVKTIIADAIYRLLYILYSVIHCHNAVILRSLPCPLWRCNSFT